MKLMFSLGSLLARLGVPLEPKLGTSRTVWVFRRWGFALKFPVFRLKRSVKGLRHVLFGEKRQRDSRWSDLRDWFCDDERLIHNFHGYILKGLLANWREFTFFLRHPGHPLLLPTYFSLFGLVNVVPIGDELGCDVTKFWLTITGTIGIMEAFRDNHHFENLDNFCYGQGGVPANPRLRLARDPGHPRGSRRRALANQSAATRGVAVFLFAPPLDSPAPP